jgi:hypothetical protein
MHGFAAGGDRVTEAIKKLLGGCPMKEQIKKGEGIYVLK